MENIAWCDTMWDGGSWFWPYNTDVNQLQQSLLFAVNIAQVQYSRHLFNCRARAELENLNTSILQRCAQPFSSAFITTLYATNSQFGSLERRNIAYQPYDISTTSMPTQRPDTRR